MKCLIASGDTLARVTVQKLLTELKLPVQAVANGAAAFIGLQKPDGPRLAILDVNLPGFSGVDVVKKLRAAPNGGEYSVLMILPKGTTELAPEAVELVDAFIPRPIVMDDLRVAVSKCLDRKAEAKPDEPAPQTTPAPAPPHSSFRRPPHLGRGMATAPAGPRISSPFATLTPLAKGNELLVTALSGMGLSSVSVVAAGAAKSAADISAWSVLVLPTRAIWIDLLVESDRNSMRQLFAAMTGNDEPSEEDLSDVMRETVNIVQGTFKTAFQKEKLEVFTPVLPQSVDIDRVGSWREQLSDPIRYEFVAGATKIAVTLFPKQTRPEMRAADSIRIKHVVSQAVNAPGSEDVVLVPKGTMLTARSLEKLRNIAENEAEGFAIETIEHSPLTEALIKLLGTT